MTMHPRTLISILAAGLVVALASGAGTAPAASYIHAGTTTGNLLAAGTPIMPGSIVAAVRLDMPSLGTVTCTTVTGGSATVGASGGATIAAVGDSLAFTTCTDEIPVIHFTRCDLVPPLPTGTITATGSAGGTVSFSNTYMKCLVAPSTTNACYFAAALAVGTATNTPSTLTYDNVAVTHTVPPGGTGDLGALCAGTLNDTLTARVTDITGGASASTLVLNQTP